jgi:amino acid transporter
MHSLVTRLCLYPGTLCHSLTARAQLTHAPSFWSKVNSFTQTPVNAVWLVVTFCSCLNLIGIGSPQTIVGIFSITAPALDLSYIAVIIAHRVYEHRVPFISGPYTMGRWSKPVNLVAVVWVLFISVVLFFPPIKPVTAANMNYAICVAAVISIIAMSWWYLSAKKYDHLHSPWVIC